MTDKTNTNPELVVNTPETTTENPDPNGEKAVQQVTDFVETIPDDAKKAETTTAVADYIESHDDPNCKKGWGDVLKLLTEFFGDIQLNLDEDSESSSDEITPDESDTEKTKNPKTTKKSAEFKKALKDIEISPSTTKNIDFLMQYGKFDNEKHKSRLSSLNPELLKVMVATVGEFPNALISGTIRTEEENQALIENRLISKGFSKDKIANMSKSQIYDIAGVDENTAHMFGMAIDFGNGSKPKPDVLSKWINKKFPGQFTTLVHAPGPHLHLGLKGPRLEENRVDNAQLAQNQESYNKQHLNQNA